MFFFLDGYEHRVSSFFISINEPLYTMTEHGDKVMCVDWTLNTVSGISS